MFEDMVRHAETKLFERERQTNRQTSAEAKAEELASELLHQPGSKLQSDELARLFFLSGCQEVLEEDENMPTNCLEDPALRRYRTRTGVCNNLQNPLFGAANKPFRRLIDAQYEDGVSQLRGTMQGQQTGLFHHGPFGSPNPSARLVSQTVVRDRLDEQDGISHLTTIWGAFIDHEFAATPAFADCPANCNTDVERCVPIPIPQGDPAFGEQLECHPFARSIPACEGPRAGVVPSRQQINEITAFVDGSEIYGTTEVIVNAVREPGTARLRVGPNIPCKYSTDDRIYSWTVFLRYKNNYYYTGIYLRVVVIRIYILVYLSSS